MSQKQQKIKTLLIRPLVSLKKFFGSKRMCPPQLKPVFKTHPFLDICSRNFLSHSSITRPCCHPHWLCACRGFICPLCPNSCFSVVSGDEPTEPSLTSVQREARVQTQAITVLHVSVNPFRNSLVLTTGQG